MESDDLPRWLDGPAFTAWLDQMRIRVKWTHDPSQARNILEWRKGRAVNVMTADELLVEHGYTIHDLPNDLWRDPPPFNENKRDWRTWDRRTESVQVKLTPAERAQLGVWARDAGCSMSEFIRRQMGLSVHIAEKSA